MEVLGIVLGVLATSSAVILRAGVLSGLAAFYISRSSVQTTA